MKAFGVAAVAALCILLLQAHGVSADSGSREGSERPASDPAAGIAAGSAARKTHEAKITRVKVMPGRLTIDAPAKVNFKVAVTNKGDRQTGFMRVWLDSSSPHVRIKRQFPIKTIIPGWTVTGTITVEFGRKARGKIDIGAQAWGTEGKAVVTVR